MKKNNIILLIIAIVTLLVTIIGATFAYFATGNMNITNVANANTVTERNNMVFDVIGGDMSLNITAANMVEAKIGNVAAYNNTTLTVNFTANTDYSMVCTYDIIYEWTSTDRYTTHSTGETNIELGIIAYLESGTTTATEGNNYISTGADLADIVGNQNSAVVVSGAKISGIGSTTETAVWYLESAFVNTPSDQSTLSGKTYAGKFRVANVSCVAGTASPSSLTSYWFDTTTCTYSNPCTFPNYGGTLQSSGSATGHNVYIGQDSSKYYACATIQGHEICLSQPYTQYGLSGHTLNSTLTSEQQASVKQALYQAFIDAGITINISTVAASADGAGCTVGGLNCGVNILGYVNCSDDSMYEGCGVDASGHAYCGSWGGG